MKKLNNVQSKAVAIAAVKTEVVISEAKASAAIAEIIANDKATFKGVTSADVSSFVGECLEASAGGMRKAILAIDASIRTGATFADEVKVTLSSRYAVGTVNCIFTAARKTVPALREMGISPSSVDVYNLRAVNKALCDKTHKAHSAVVKAIKDGKAASAVAKVYADKAPKAERKAGGETAVVEPAKTVNSADGIVARIKADVAELARDKSFGEKQARFLLLKVARQLGATVEEFNQAAGRKH